MKRLLSLKVCTVAKNVAFTNEPKKININTQVRRVHRPAYSSFMHNKEET